MSLGFNALVVVDPEPTHELDVQVVDNLKNQRALRAASHYGRRSRCRRSPPIMLQETMNSTSHPFTLRPKSKSYCKLKCLFSYKGNKLSKEVWAGLVWKPILWLRGCRFFSLKNSIIDKMLAVRLKGLFWARNKVGCSSGVGLWAW